MSNIVSVYILHKQNSLGFSKFFKNIKDFWDQNLKKTWSSIFVLQVTLVFLLPSFTFLNPK